MELDRRELADRLILTFKEEVSEIWVVMVEGSVEDCELGLARISRIMSGSSSWGWFRIGTKHTAIVVAVRKQTLRAVRRSIGRSVSLTRVLRRRGRRAWEKATAGIMYSRGVYGEDTNRWYMRGLKRVPKAKRVGVWRGRVRLSHPEMRAGVAGARGGLSIHPPEAYRPPRLNKRAAHAGGRWARIRGNVEPIGIVLSTLALLPDFAMREARTDLKEQRSILLTGRYSSSRVLDRSELEGWVSRMVAKSRARGDP